MAENAASRLADSYVAQARLALASQEPDRARGLVARALAAYPASNEAQALAAQLAGGAPSNGPASGGPQNNGALSTPIAPPWAPTPPSPPRGYAQSAGPAAHTSRAGFGVRVAAYLLDLALFVGALYLMAFAIGFTGLLGASAAKVAEADLQPTVLVLWFGSLWVFNAIGHTPGQRLFGLRIVRTDGTAPGLAVGLGRTLATLLSGAFFHLGYLWALWDREGQTWHDHLAGTHVIKIS